MKNICKCCHDGFEDYHGDVWFAEFPNQRHTRIAQRGKKYFMYDLDSSLCVEIKACPICGRSLLYDKRTLAFSEKLELSDAFDIWYEKEGIHNFSLSMVDFLCAKGLLDLDRVKQFLKENNDD